MNKYVANQQVKINAMKRNTAGLDWNQGMVPERWGLLCEMGYSRAPFCRGVNEWVK